MLIYYSWHKINHYFYNWWVTSKQLWIKNVSYFISQIIVYLKCFWNIFKYFSFGNFLFIYLSFQYCFPKLLIEAKNFFVNYFSWINNHANFQIFRKYSWKISVGIKCKYNNRGLSNDASVITRSKDFCFTFYVLFCFFSVYPLKKSQNCR